MAQGHHATVLALVKLSTPDAPLLLLAFSAGAAAALGQALIPYYTGGLTGALPALRMLCVLCVLAVRAPHAARRAEWRVRSALRCGGCLPRAGVQGRGEGTGECGAAYAF